LKPILSLIFLTGLLLALSGCAKKEKISAIDLNVSGPVDAAYKDGLFFVLNSSFDRAYVDGSILVVSEEGQRLRATSIPRMARRMVLSGSDVFVTYDRAEDDSEVGLDLFSVAENGELTLQKRWRGSNLEGLDCLPINVVVDSSSELFAVGCNTGKVFLGKFNQDRSQTQLKLIRHYLYPRRAMLIDSTRQTLLMFPTNLGLQSSADLLSEDIGSYDPESNQLIAQEGGNEVPDTFELSRFKFRNSKNLRRRYQFVSLDLSPGYDGIEYAQVERFLPEDDPDRELRWLYFTLADADGTLDTAAGFLNLNQKHYRTNIFAAQADPNDADVFYLSHRGKQNVENRFANSIIKVRIKGDLSDKSANTSEVFEFERIYGFKGELDERHHFPSHFFLGDVLGRRTLLVNHFKDLVNFRGDSRFSIAAKLLVGGQNWVAEVLSGSQVLSYHGFAVSPTTGKILSCSFYGNRIVPMQLVPGRSFALGWGDILSL
jgi:hypothetical protein